MRPKGQILKYCFQQDEKKRRTFSLLLGLFHYLHRLAVWPDVGRRPVRDALHVHGFPTRLQPPGDRSGARKEVCSISARDKLRTYLYPTAESVAAARLAGAGWTHTRMGGLERKWRTYSALTAA